MQGESRPSCYGIPEEDRVATPWCQDCPLGGLAALAIDLETNATQIEEEINNTGCSGKQQRRIEGRDCGISIVNVCGNSVVGRLVANYQNQDVEPVQS